MQEDEDERHHDPSQRNVGRGMRESSLRVQEYANNKEDIRTWFIMKLILSLN